MLLSILVARGCRWLAVLSTFEINFSSSTVIKLLQAPYLVNSTVGAYACAQCDATTTANQDIVAAGNFNAIDTIVCGVTLTGLTERPTWCLPPCQTVISALSRFVSVFEQVFLDALSPWPPYAI